MEEDNQVIKQLLCVCEDVGRHIPICESLIDEYSDFWTPGTNASEQDEKEIKAEIRSGIVQFIRNATEEEINKTLNSLNTQTMRCLSYTLPTMYRHLFLRYRDYITLPDDLVAPNIFQALSKREGTFVSFDKAIQLQYGDTKVELLSGFRLSPFDAVTLCMLIAVKNEKKIKSEGPYISFKTSMREITGKIELRNPRSKGSQTAVWNSLKRLASIVLEITKSDGSQVIDHILARVEKQALDSPQEEMTIYLNKYFIEFEETGFTSLDPKILRRLKSKTSACCGYLFLSRQQSFTNKQWYVIGLRKLHNYAGLRPENKEEWKIRQETFAMLNKLEEEEILTWRINRKRNLIAVNANVNTETRPNWDIGKPRSECKN